MKRAPLFAKHWLTLAGGQMPGSSLSHLQMVINYMRLGRWMRDRGFNPKRVKGRKDVFNEVASQVKDRRVLYLEFGVYQGRAMRYWSRALTNPLSHLHGFDSFEGLPESFDKWGKGAFDTGGQVPVFPDPRVRFFKGWFEDTLPGYEPPPHDALVMNLDADLYSSTKTVLDRFSDLIVPGSYLYFDDLSRIDHEPRAFDEFMAATGKKFDAIAADASLNTAFFQCKE